MQHTIAQTKPVRDGFWMRIDYRAADLASRPDGRSDAVMFNTKLHAAAAPLGLELVMGRFSSPSYSPVWLSGSADPFRLVEPSTGEFLDETIAALAGRYLHNGWRSPGVLTQADGRTHEVKPATLFSNLNRVRDAPVVATVFREEDGPYLAIRAPSGARTHIARRFGPPLDRGWKDVQGWATYRLPSTDVHSRLSAIAYDLSGRSEDPLLFIDPERRPEDIEPYISAA